MSEDISIIGGGSWGTALASLLSKNKHQVLIYVRDSDLADSINNENINRRYFPDTKLSKLIRATTDLSKAVNYGDYIVMSVPTDATRMVMKKIEPLLSKDQIIISTAKGIEENSYLRNTEIIAQFCTNEIVALSGPTHAEEVIKELPSAAVIAGKNRKIAERVQDIFMSDTFRVYTNPDIKGVEMGGAVKNIIAVASGISDGLGYGDNSRAALITRGLTEISRLGTHLNCKILTFAGLSGMGDLVVTCTSMHSRNRRFGINIGKGLNFQEALDKVGQAVEGVKTTRAIYNWKKEENFDFDLPITTQIYKVLFKGKKPLQAVDDLMLRGPKNEMENVVEESDW
ncbi:MAG: NAD(P)H-dependent glycerol-3-phosphate dehydrogenase [Halanaerobiales bacterium]